MDVAKGCGDGEETIGNFAQGVVDLENLLGQVTCGGDMYSTRNTGDERDEHSFFPPYLWSWFWNVLEFEFLNIGDICL